MKYVYDWLKPRAASARTAFGRVKASARKRTSGWTALTSAITHSQKANGLVCGLSTRNARTPCPIQKRKTSRHASQSALRSAHQKSSGTMSSNVYGGFSAHRIEPSGRRANQSGCSWIQG
jgi:hypothetical protein